MRAVLLTGTALRHQFIANYVAQRLDLAGVWQEQKPFQPHLYAGTDEEHAVIAAHFATRDASEEAFFADHRHLALAPGAHVVVGPPGIINDPAEIEEMAALDPDVLLVFGTGLLRAPIIGRFEGRIINLHLGLSPYYRGSGTNFWPLVNREPEYVGATIHYLDAGIDTGPIIAHSRPEMAASDGPHEIGNKAIISAADVFVRAAQTRHAGGVRAVPQIGRGRLYQRKDFSADAVRRLQKNFRTGMVPEYLANKSSRDALIALQPLETAT